MVMRADARLGLVTEVEELLEDVDAVFYSHDVPWQFVGHDFVSGGGSREGAISVTNTARAEGESERIGVARRIL